jgi:aminobenzoyl-glutamate transport protein
VAFVACQGHVMSDASFLVIPPLAALVFRAVGRHPLAGLIGAYACLGTGYGGGLLVGWLIQDSPLRGPGGSLIPSPLLSNLVPIIALVFFLFGYTYGRAVGLAKEDRNVYKLMTNAIKEMGGFITLIFIVAQTLSVLSWSGLATYLAVELASTAKAIGLVGFPALLFLVVLSTVLNLVITSGSGLWSLESTVMVPALMLLGLSPAMIQATHRIGDSITQAVSPMHIFLYFILAEAKKYEPDLKLGTLVSRLLPFVPAFGLVWTVVLAIFYFTGLPVGPGASAHLP